MFVSIEKPKYFQQASMAALDTSFFIKYSVYTTQMNSSFHACWLACLGVNSEYYSPPRSWWDKIMHQGSFPTFLSYIERDKLVFWYMCGIY